MFAQSSYDSLTNRSNLGIVIQNRNAHTHTHWSMNFSDPNPLGEDVKNKNTDGLQYWLTAWSRILYEAAAHWSPPASYHNKEQPTHKHSPVRRGQKEDSLHTYVTYIIGSYWNDEQKDLYPSFNWHVWQEQMDHWLNLHFHYIPKQNVLEVMI